MRLLNNILAISVLIVSVITLLCSFFVPIYTDEVGWNILQARFFIDDFTNITLFPQCGASFATDVPWFMVPARVVDALLYTHLSSPLWLRGMGIANVLIWLALVFALVPRVPAANLSGLSLWGVVAAFLGLGCLPFMMVINRPEQLLLIGLTVLLLLPFTSSEKQSLQRDILLGLIYIVFAVITFAQHAKGVLFFPIMIVGIFFLLRRWSARIGSSALLAYFALHSYHYWTERVKCPDDPAFEAAFSRNEIVPLLEIFSRPGDILYDIIKNSARSIKYAYSILFHGTYSFHWLPMDDGLHLREIIVNIFIVILFFMLAGIFLLSSYKLIANASRSSHERRRTAMVFAGLTSLTALSVLQAPKLWYESILIVPFAAVLLLISLPQPATFASRAYAELFCSFLMTLSLISQALLWSSFVPHIPALVRGGYIEDQPTLLSFSGFDYDDIRVSIAETAEMCDIPISPETRHLVVDDLTYVALAETYRPFHIMYILRAGGEKSWSLLRNRQSAGLIAGCHNLPAEMREEALRNGALCCFPSFAP